MTTRVRSTGTRRPTPRGAAARDRATGRGWTWGLAIYWGLLFTATHLPGSVFEGIPRPESSDLVVHFAAYTGLSLLLARCLGSRAGRLGWVFLIGVTYAAVDELLQPFTRRHASWWDFLADVAGILVAITLVWVFSPKPRKRPPTKPFHISV